MSWIKKLANEEVAVWKNIALYHVGKTGLRIDSFNCNCSLKVFWSSENRSFVFNQIFVYGTLMGVDYKSEKKI